VGENVRKGVLFVRFCAPFDSRLKTRLKSQVIELKKSEKSFTAEVAEGAERGKLEKIKEIRHGLTQDSHGLLNKGAEDENGH